MASTNDTNTLRKYCQFLDSGISETTWKPWVFFGKRLFLFIWHKKMGKFRSLHLKEAHKKELKPARIKKNMKISNIG